MIQGFKEAAKAAAEWRKEQSDFVTLDNGKETVIRFLSDIDNDDIVTVFQHFVNRKPFVCRAEEGVCPLCESNDPQVRQRSVSVMFNVYDQIEKRVKILRAKPNKRSTGLFDEIVRYAEEHGTITDRDYRLKAVEEKVGSNTYVAYHLISRDKDKSVDPPKDAQKINLSLLVVVPTEEAMKEAIK